jgi:branched-chain amino acid transport system ATP-binding protein
MSALETVDVTRFFGGLAAVSNVSFQVKQGEIVGLIGPNGAGKTTIFNLINNYFSPTSGEIVFQGENITGLPTHEICKRGIARTFQVVKPFRRMSVLDNIMTSAFLRYPKAEEAREKARWCLDFTDLLAYQNTLGRSLPLGQRKRLEIARALATEPKLLLLDETCAGLNPSELNEAIDIIRKINQELGITIIIIEHHMKVIMSISHRIVVLHHGQKISEGTPQQVVSSPQVVEAYLGEKYAAS